MGEERLVADGRRCGGVQDVGREIGEGLELGGSGKFGGDDGRVGQ